MDDWQINVEDLSGSATDSLLGEGKGGLRVEGSGVTQPGGCQMDKTSI